MLRNPRTVRRGWQKMLRNPRTVQPFLAYREPEVAVLSKATYAEPTEIASKANAFFLSKL